MGTVKKPDMLDEARFNVAAVNACKGIPTEILEKGYIDAILVAAQAWYESHHPYGADDNTTRLRGYLYDRVMRLNQALAKLEGK